MHYSFFALSVLNYVTNLKNDYFFACIYSLNFLFTEESGCGCHSVLSPFRAMRVGGEMIGQDVIMIGGEGVMIVRIGAGIINFQQ